MEEIKYTDLKPGDTIAWKVERDGEKMIIFDTIKTFHTAFIDPIGCIETANGYWVKRKSVDYKVVSDKKIYVINK